jgi:hypothetical protein
VAPALAIKLPTRIARWLLVSGFEDSQGWNPVKDGCDLARPDFIEAHSADFVQQIDPSRANAQLDEFSALNGIL